MNEPATVDRLRKLLRYDAVTGKLFWRSRDAVEFSSAKYALIWNGRYADTEAGTVSHDGYRYVRVAGKRVLAHRLAWAIVHGVWPLKALDHLDHDRLNNHMSNLHEAGYDGNALNRSMRHNNTSGCVGVEERPAGTWSARIEVRGRREYIGTFRSFEEAAVARKKAEERLGFSANHGRRR